MIRSRSAASTSRWFCFSFLITRLVAIGDEWMLSGPTTILRPSDQKRVHQVAFAVNKST
jgi:hypothetical protein